MTGDGAMPRSANLVVLTDRHLLWCNKSRLSNETVVLGADSLAAVNSVESADDIVALLRKVPTAA